MKKLYVVLSIALCMAASVTVYSMDPIYKKMLQKKGASNFFEISLIRAAQQGDLENIKELINELGTSIDFQSMADGNTALIEAVINNRPQVVDYLIKNGADVSLTNNNGKSALDYALENNDQAMANRILDAAAAQ